MGRRAGQAHGMASLGLGLLGQTLNMEVPGQSAGVRQALGLPGGEQALDPAVSERREACRLQLSSQFYSEDIDSIEEESIKLADL